MNIVSTEFSLKFSSLDIYVSGCLPPHCFGCHNPELWDFDIGQTYDESIKNVIETINDNSSLIENVMIFGGEPLDQDRKKLLDMIQKIKDTRKNVWIFTRYDLEEIPQEIKDSVDYIKCGRYIQSLACTGRIQYGIELATSNQTIYRMKTDG